MAYKNLFPVLGVENAAASDEGGSLLLRRALLSSAPETAPTPGLLYYRRGPRSPWEFVCHTLERPGVVVGSVGPRIPAGTYPLSLQYSPTQASRTWSRDPRRPLLWNVPGREAIQIHAGSSMKDSKGCILVGHFSQYLNHLDWDDSKQTFLQLRNLWDSADPKDNPQRIIIQEVEL